MAKTYKASVLHGVRISAKTKQEFYANKEAYKSEGIRSAYGLQIQKNISSRLQQAETLATKKAIQKAYELDRQKFQELAITVKDLQKSAKIIREYNRRVEKAIAEKKILRDTATAHIPINIRTGRIDLKRLDYILEKIQKYDIRQISTQQTAIFYRNLEWLYGQQFVDDVKKLLKGASIQTITDEFKQYPEVSMIVKYDIDNFTDEEKEEQWKHLKGYKFVVWGICEDIQQIVARRGY